jgi:hypothetical protein
MNVNKTKWYKAWMNARQRCTNPNATKYEYYGGRGIKCFLLPCEAKELWERDKADLLKCASIDRIDPNGNYTFKNCRFIEFQENRKRKGLTKYVSSGILKRENSKEENKMTTKAFSEVDAIIAFECGELDEDGVIELFQHLVDNGHAWSLQGSYGRTAKALIEAGYVSLPKGK